MDLALTQSSNPRSDPRGAHAAASRDTCSSFLHLTLYNTHQHSRREAQHHRHRSGGMASYTHPSTSLRPQNISNRPNPTDTIYIETATMAPPPPAQAVAGQPNPDLAGVLRRNQACLNCRRRKLVGLSSRDSQEECGLIDRNAMLYDPIVGPVYGRINMQ